MSSQQNMTYHRDNELIGDIKVLKAFSNAEEARKILVRVAKLTRPVMVRRGWQVGRLLEYFPKDKSLYGINVNHGKDIKIRLRNPNSPHTFLSMNFILGTMLHELGHIEVGPHNQNFYDLLNRIKVETEEAISKDRQLWGIYSGDESLRNGIKLDTEMPRIDTRSKQVMRELRLKAIERKCPGLLSPEPIASVLRGRQQGRGRPISIIEILDDDDVTWIETSGSAAAGDQMDKIVSIRDQKDSRACSVKNTCVVDLHSENERMLSSHAVIISLDSDSDNNCPKGDSRHDIICLE
ncbi:hypothetical protein EV182_001838 [Spiromyces aspiralis]|uniref:Uncharacterized protein n=1 Tax=Spiromyces aspiralis TaxID=68401 RepID=A0ACC1HSL0_9FUNG|nr:hypothetical protein EV182_001838 [Spiromyces aspiralis]